MLKGRRKRGKGEGWRLFDDVPMKERTVVLIFLIFVNVRVDNPNKIPPPNPNMVISSNVMSRPEQEKSQM